MAKTFEFKGGEKLQAKLRELADKANKDALLKVGFMEGSMETKGNVPSAYVAFINEFGGTIPERTVPEYMTSIYRRVDKNGDFLNEGKFVKRGQSNFETEHVVPEHKIPEHTIPSRPFFRRMIANGEKHWGDDLGVALTKNGLDVDKAMAFMGEQLTEELQESIQAPGYKPLAPSTIAAKGHDQTLIDSGDMINAVKFEIE